VKVFNQKNVEQSDSVVVMGAGPSLQHNLDKIKDYIAENDSLVVAAGRQFPIEADYTLFVDEAQYNSYRKQVRSPHVILPIYHRSLVKTKHDYLFTNCTLRPKVYYVKRIRVTEDGEFQHGIGSSGFSAIITSVFFRPKKLLIVGIDGPTKIKKDYYSVKFNGERNKYRRGKKKYWEDKIKFVKSDKMWKFLRKYNVSVESFQSDRVWGVDKKERNIAVLD